MLQISTPDQRQLLRSTLTNLVHLGKVGPGLRVSRTPLPIYVLGTKSLQERDTAIGKAMLVGWRYFAGNAAGEVVAADISADQPPRVMGLLVGDPAKDAFLSADGIKNHKRVKEGYHDVRILRISGALVSALWVKPITLCNDGFCVVQDLDFTDGKDPDKTYEMIDFLTKLWSAVDAYGKAKQDDDMLPEEEHPRRARKA